MKFLQYKNSTKIVASLTLLCSIFANTTSYAGYLQNFDEPNTSQLINAIQNRNVHIVQLGDSHTAGDSLTDAMRSTLQNQLGDGGMGWAMPMYFSGQRLARFGYDNVAFQPISSRSNQQENYTLGGLIAKPLQQGATLTLKSKRGNQTPQRISVSLRQGQGDGKFIVRDASGKMFNLEAPVKNNTWQLVNFTATLPFTIQADNTPNSVIGGWWAFNAQHTGATVSALGINGAELSHMNRWNSQAWQHELSSIHPQLVILAFGTNEAYNHVNAEFVRSELTQRIQQIRRASPQSAIMVVSAPESLKSTAGQCGTRPTQLTAIQQAQKQVAQAQHTLYWDWQQAMGGSCSMKSWINQGKASKDGVHFSGAGYTQLGYALADDILALNHTNISPSTGNTMPAMNTPNSNYSAPMPSKPTPSFNPNGSATICISDEHGKQQCNTTPAKHLQ